MLVNYTSPGGAASALLFDMQKQAHTLIAGTTGSGKSTLIKSFIHSILFDLPTEKQLVLIDPKRVELRQFRNVPHTIKYASEFDDIVRALDFCVSVMENRYRRMARKRQTESEEPHIYIIVDEFADLMTMRKHDTVTNLCRIAQLGRAAHIHLVLCTQRPTRDIITGQIKVNIDCRVALRCPTAQDSRNVLGFNGAELLPRYGQALYLTPELTEPELWVVRQTPQKEIDEMIKYWEAQKPRGLLQRIFDIF